MTSYFARKRSWIVTGIVGVALVATGSFGVRAFPRYNDGCHFCHGSFTDDTSPRGTVFPGNDKHTMHRASNAMNTECNLCHSQGDGNNPYINVSDGTANNPGLGCTGCHQPAGLRLHHVTAGQSCAPCHTPTSAPAESTVPTYYGTADTNADDPCNSAGLADPDENWSIGDTLGLDNDGDGLYDAADPDCSTTATSPGEAGDPGTTPLLVTSHDHAAGQVGLGYGPACAASEHDVVYGTLADVDLYAYTGITCGIGTGGSASWAYPAGSVFFLVVAQGGSSQGSYGVTSDGTERPAAGLSTCGASSQDLASRCDAR